MVAFNKLGYPGLSYQQSGLLRLNKRGTFIQMPQRAQFTHLVLVDTVAVSLRNTISWGGSATRVHVSKSTKGK